MWSVHCLLSVCSCGGYIVGCERQTCTFWRIHVGWFGCIWVAPHMHLSFKMSCANILRIYLSEKFCTPQNHPRFLWAASHLFTDINVCPACLWSNRPHSLAPNLPSVKKKNLSRNLSPWSWLVDAYTHQPITRCLTSHPTCSSDKINMAALVFNISSKS